MRANTSRRPDDLRARDRPALGAGLHVFRTGRCDGLWLGGSRGCCDFGMSETGLLFKLRWEGLSEEVEFVASAGEMGCATLIVGEGATVRFMTLP